MDPSSNTPFSSKMLIIGSVVVLIFLAVVYFAVSQVMKNKGGQGAQTITPTVVQNQTGSILPTTAGGAPRTTGPVPTVKIVVPPKGGVLAKVGEEYIYKTDLERVLSFFTLAVRKGSEQAMISKLINESIALQEGAKMHIVTLEPSIYNNQKKDYVARNKAVKTVMNSINKTAGDTSVAIISIWFYNNDKAGTMGYDKGKVFALQKISAVYDKVKSGALTMEQAGKLVAQDTTLTQIDPGYRQNAYSIRKGLTMADSITFDAGFDAKIRALKAGQMTDISILQTTDSKTKKRMDAVYIFAKVISNTVNASKGYKDYDDWIEMNKKTYSIQMY